MVAKRTTTIRITIDTLDMLNDYKVRQYGSDFSYNEFIRDVLIPLYQKSR